MNFCHTFSTNRAWHGLERKPFATVVRSRRLECITSIFPDVNKQPWTRRKRSIMSTHFAHTRTQQKDVKFLLENEGRLIERKLARQPLALTKSNFNQMDVWFENVLLEREIDKSKCHAI